MKRVLEPHTYNGKKRSLFLAGGTTLWRDRFVKMLSSLPIVIFEPVIKTYDRATSAKWSEEHSDKATAIAFWFPQENCPVSLYELGGWAATDKQLFVGTHPFYYYREDIKAHLAYARPELYVVHTLDDLAYLVKAYYAAN